MWLVTNVFDRRAKKKSVLIWLGVTDLNDLGYKKIRSKSVKKKMVWELEISFCIQNVKVHETLKAHPVAHINNKGSISVWNKEGSVYFQVWQHELQREEKWLESCNTEQGYLPRPKYTKHERKGYRKKKSLGNSQISITGRMWKEFFKEQIRIQHICILSGYGSRGYHGRVQYWEFPIKELWNMCY